jgi:hypothetical protein
VILCSETEELYRALRTVFRISAKMRQLIVICALLMAPELTSSSKQVDNRTKRQMSIEEGINLPRKPRHGNLDLHLGVDGKIDHGHPSVSCYQCSDRVSCSKFEHTKKEDRVGYIKKCEGEEITSKLDDEQKKVN